MTAQDLDERPSLVKKNVRPAKKRWGLPRLKRTTIVLHRWTSLVLGLLFAHDHDLRCLGRVRAGVDPLDQFHGVPRHEDGQPDSDD